MATKNNVETGLHPFVCFPFSTKVGHPVGLYLQALLYANRKYGDSCQLEKLYYYRNDLSSCSDVTYSKVLDLYNLISKNTSTTTTTTTTKTTTIIIVVINNYGLSCCLFWLRESKLGFLVICYASGYVGGQF
jgi:hypothetical protein